MVPESATVMRQPVRGSTLFFSCHITLFSIHPFNILYVKLVMIFVFVRGGSMQFFQKMFYNLKFLLGLAYYPKNI
jgi:hypothetical protein